MNPLSLKTLTSGPGLRLAGLGILILVLLIPLSFIDSRVQERSARRAQAVQEVAYSWGGGNQVVAGPFLRVPYTQHVVLDDGKERDEIRYVVIAPETLNVDAQLDSEKRHRGIFEVPVFKSDLVLSGRFRLDPEDPLPVASPQLHWSHAELVLAITEPRSLSAESRLLWNGHAIGLKPSAPGLDGHGIHARIVPEFMGDGPEGLGEFRLDLDLHGSQSLRFAPVARSTHVHLVSDWPHPSFQGDWLPLRSAIDAHGFDASWAVSHLGRDYPTSWTEGAVPVGSILGATLGVDFNVPIDTYRMAERIAKYGVLLLLLGFATVWVMELLGGQPLHAVQVLLLGASLCLFGLLQLALAEHLGFALAYGIAAAAVVLQASWFLHTATRSWRRASTLALILSGWFSWLYVAINAEDYAFLLGALAMFGALTGVMWATRRVDWSGERKWDVATATVGG